MFCRANTVVLTIDFPSSLSVRPPQCSWEKLTLSVSGVSLSVTRFACEPHSLYPQCPSSAFCLQEHLQCSETSRHSQISHHIVACAGPRVGS